MIRASRFWGVPKQQEERQGDREEGDELSVGRGHAIAFAIHFYHCALALCVQLPGQSEKNPRFGRSSLMMRFSRKFKASQPICPTNISRISTSREDHISVA